MRLVGVAAMRELDRRTVEEHGLPVRALMEVAGAALAREAAALRGAAGGPVVLLCGGGHNGGDGLAAARHLRAAGLPAEVVLCADPGRLTGAPAENLGLLRAAGVPVRDGRALGAGELEALLRGAGAVCDCLLGTGFRGPVRAPLPELIAAISSCGRPVVAADMPSGLSGEPGLGPDGPCVRASRTVCFGAVKAGVFAEPGRTFAGEVTLEPLGIPEAAWEGLDVLEGLEAAAAAARLPRRCGAGHKGTYGTVLVLAGAAGFAGAAALCAEGALRSGAGLCRVACPQPVAATVAGHVREATVRALPAGPDGGLAPEAADLLPELLEGVDAVVAGPGLRLGPGVRPVLARLLAAFPGPLVLDADACNAADPELLRTAAGAVVITPHPGEAGRLLSCTAADIQRDRVGSARRLAAGGRCVAVLKGAGTLVAIPGGAVACNPTGNDGMGTGGSGDVLAGLLGGLCAQGAEPFAAATAGVYVHGLAGDLAAAALGRRAMLAGDILRHLPAAFAALLGAGA